MRANKAIALTTAALVFLVALGSFTLSYNALRDYAAHNGIPGHLAYIWPLLIDFALIVFSLSVVNSYLQSESTFKQWGLVGVYTLATIGFNVAHAPGNLAAQIVAAIAPVSLFFSFELLMGQLKTSVKKQGLARNIEQLGQDLNAKRSTVQNVDQQLEQKRSTIERLDEQIAELKRSIKAQNIVQFGDLNAANEARLDGKQLALNALLNFYRSNPNATLGEAGEAIERSKGTVSNYLNELEQAGLIHRNGNGIEVTQ